MQRKREIEFERRLEARVKMVCAGGGKGGSAPAPPPPAAPPPPPDLGPDTAKQKQDAEQAAASRKGALANQLTGPSGASGPTVSTPTLAGGTKTLLG